MRYHDHGSLKTVQIILQPLQHRLIQMVCRLVKQKNVKIPGKRPCKRCFLLLSSGKMLHLLLIIRKTEAV